MTTNNIPALPQVRDLVQNNRPLAEEEAEIARLPWMLRLTALTFVALVAGGLAERAAAPDWTAPALFLLAYAAGGFFSVQQAWATLNARQFDVNVLMIVAAIGAALIGEPQEGAILMFLFSLSNTLETFAMGRTHASVRALLDLSPREAEVYRDGVLMRVPVESLRVGQVVLVRPGAQIPADGLVLKGEGAVNEASITGESMPVEKRPGSRTFAGTLNGQGALQITVSTAVENSTLARIVAVVREAREQKAASQDFTDRVVGQYYAYAVVAMTLLAIIIPLFFLGWDAPTTLYRAFTLMVVASPCALVISIPATLLSALASSARGGVLFKGGRYLEAAARVRVVAFDKTGTLTTGKPQVVEIIPIDSSFELSAISHQPSALLSLAAAVEQYSEHPLARAIVGAAQERGLVIAEAQQFVALTGSGAQAEVAGRQLRIGRPDLFELGADVAAQVVAQERQGRTLVVLGAGQQPLGLIALADTLRPEAAATVRELHAAGIRVALLSGDSRRVVAALAASLGIDEVHAELLPEQKVEVIRQLQAKHGPLAMIGDGVNDAPALATAALGVAMGVAGSDVALESADVLLMGDALDRLPRALAHARRARRVVRQNLVFSFGVIAVLIVCTLLGEVPLPLGVIGHEGSTLLVAANGLRLLRGWRS